LPCTLSCATTGNEPAKGGQIIGQRHPLIQIY
jgi:hypothetical protein